MKSNSVQDIYPFLKFSPGNRSDYLPPNYYDSIIKPYSVKGTEDFKCITDSILSLPDSATVVELGGGSGRVTRHATDLLDEKQASYHVNDLSPAMVSILKDNFPRTNVYELDHLAFLEKIPKVVDSIDYIFSLWSLSHSLQQEIEKCGYEKAYDRFYSVLQDIIDKMKPKSEITIIHFDLTTPEQAICQRQYGKYFAEFNPKTLMSGQAPSKRILDRTIELLRSDGSVTFEVQRVSGDPIYYENSSEALEVLMNFHMEGEFNSHVDLEEIVAEVLDDIKSHTLEDGRVVISTGWYLYRIFVNTAAAEISRFKSGA